MASLASLFSPDMMQPLQPQPFPGMGPGELDEGVPGGGEPIEMEGDEGPLEEMPGDNVVPMDDRIPEELQKLRRSLVFMQRAIATDNAAELVEESVLAKIGDAVCREYKIDRDSRADWEKTARRAMDMARQKKEAKSHPWEGASNVKFPMLTTAALQFAARAYPAIVDGPRIVKVTVLGRDLTGEKAASADRVSQHMSYQLLQEMENWEGEMDTCLHQLPIIGCAFKKVYPDPTREAGACSDLVSAFDLVVHQKTKNLHTCPRATHVFTLYPYEFEERQRDGRFLDVPLTNSGDGSDGDDSEAPHTFLEQHRFWDIDDDGTKEPWIITVHEPTQKVVRIRPAFGSDDWEVDPVRGRIMRIKRKCYFVKIPFIPDPEGGFYDIGFGKLLEALSDVVDTTINQMMDAGTLQNSGGGFIGGSVKLGKGQMRFKPGEYKSVQAVGADVKNNIVSIDHPGPSAVLFNLLSLMIDAGKDIASVKDVLTGETPTNQTATSTMAAIEQGLKVFTAIYKRIFRALKVEFRMIFDINKETLRLPKYVALLDEPVEVIQADYMGDMDIMPVADPNTVTDMQRMSKAQFLLEEIRQGNPVIDVFAATKRALEAARIERIDEIIAKPKPNPAEEVAVADAAAGVELKKAQTVKTVADATTALATVGIPVGQPAQIAEPIFVPAGAQMGQPPGMAAEPPPDAMGAPPDAMPPDMMGGGMQDVPPEMMQGEIDPSLMGGATPDMGDLPPEAQPY